MGKRRTSPRPAETTLPKSLPSGRSARWERIPGSSPQSLVGDETRKRAKGGGLGAPRPLPPPAEMQVQV